MYADFESILEPMGPVELGSPNPNQLYTNEVNQHTPSGWCVHNKFAYGDVDIPLRLYRGKDCIETFCNYIKGEARRLYHMFPESPMGPLTKKQWKKYKRSTKCHICYKPFILNPISPGRFNTFSTWGGGFRPPPVTLLPFIQIKPNLVC